MGVVPECADHLIDKGHSFVELRPHNIRAVEDGHEQRGLCPRQLYENSVLEIRKLFDVCHNTSPSPPTASSLPKFGIPAGLRSSLVTPRPYHIVPLSTGRIFLLRPRTCPCLSLMGGIRARPHCFIPTNNAGKRVGSRSYSAATA